MSFLNNIFTQLFQFILNGVDSLVGVNPNISYGLTIIVVTALLKIMLLPLNIGQMRSMNTMNKVQPELKRLQERYKNDPNKLNSEMRKLYSDNKVNPLAGCLPLLIQFPIIIALYNVFATLPGIEGVSFLWIKDLSKPDALYILPILAVISTYLSSLIMQTKDSPQAQQMKMMNIMMAGMIGFMSIKLSSALALYWVANSVFQIVQVFSLNKYEKLREAKNPTPKPGASTPKAKQNNKPKSISNDASKEITKNKKNK
ncbi:MAG: membrane protein insertase YidC [Clostridium sp.]